MHRRVTMIGHEDAGLGQLHIPLGLQKRSSGLVPQCKPVSIPLFFFTKLGERIYSTVIITSIILFRRIYEPLRCKIRKCSHDPELIVFLPPFSVMYEPVKGFEMPACSKYKVTSIQPALSCRDTSFLSWVPSGVLDKTGVAHTH